MDKTFEILAIRALNSSRRLYTPTYLGLRLLLNALPNHDASDWGRRFIARKLATRKSWRYRRFLGLKEIKSNTGVEYRTFVAGSPTTMLAETAILQMLSREPIFSPHPSAYSYLWPQSEKAGRSHAFYRTGYEQRNRKVTALLKANADNVALVVDIRRFYPSVSQERLLPRVETRVDQLKEKTHRDSIHSFITNLLEVSPGGIPIGPELGHVLGHVALEDVDRYMRQRFGEKYLRYVDDIIVVCGRHEVARVQKYLQGLLEEEALEFNDDKTDIVASKEWIAHVPYRHVLKDTLDFENLLRKISVYLMVHPQDIDTLQSMFRGSGFSFPFLRMKTLAYYNRYRAYVLAGLHYRRHGLPWIVDALTTTAADLLRLALDLRRTMQQELTALRDQPPPRHGMPRRWYVQKVRYLCNRLLYMIDPSEYGILYDYTLVLDELQEIRAVLTAFRHRDVTNLLMLPGRTILAFSELWAETQSGHPAMQLESKLTEPVIESLATLSLLRVIDLPAPLLQNLPEPTRTFLSYCAGHSSQPSDISKLSFVDELQTLQIGQSAEQLYDLVTTRFNDREVVSLGGVLLDDPGYASG
jgi:hypothetical protein